MAIAQGSGALIKLVLQLFLVSFIMIRAHLRPRRFLEAKLLPIKFFAPQSIHLLFLKPLIKYDEPYKIKVLSEG
jgi:hypothetical protein